jgi:hypothetical protein
LEGWYAISPIIRSSWAFACERDRAVENWSGVVPIEQHYRLCSNTLSMLALMPMGVARKIRVASSQSDRVLVE